METAPLFLGEDVYACTANNYLVFLDVNHDRYACLDRASTRAILGRIAGLHLPADAPAQPAERSSTSSSEVIEALLEKALLTTDTTGALSMNRDRVPEAQRELCAAPDASITATIASTTRAMLSARSAERQLRHKPLKQILAGIRHRRAQLAYATTGENVPAACEVAAAFLRVRHLIPRERVCLFDSLALIEFMYRHGMVPHLVFGVKMDPFAAHCWVQIHDTVLNDAIENVALYSQIMTV